MLEKRKKIEKSIFGNFSFWYFTCSYKIKKKLNKKKKFRQKWENRKASGWGKSAVTLGIWLERKTKTKTVITLEKLVRIRSETDAKRVLKGSNQSALSTVVSVSWVFQLCSIISSTHRDGAERNGRCYTLWIVEQGSSHHIVVLPKLFYAKRIAVVLTS